MDEGWDAEVGLKTEIVSLTKSYALYEGNLFQGVVKPEEIQGAENGKSIKNKTVDRKKEEIRNPIKGNFSKNSEFYFYENCDIIFL